MKWEDTALNKDEIMLRLGYLIIKSGDTREVKKVIDNQAKISFEAGIKEVVGWVESRNRHADAIGYYAISNDVWQAKLKEWGIK